MKNNIFFTTAHHSYMYSFNQKEYVLLPPVLSYILFKTEEQDQPVELEELYEDPQLAGCPPEEIRYYWTKSRYLIQGRSTEKEVPEFGELSSVAVEDKLDQLNVLTFEVTDRCNLRCRYCTYGEMYGGYDERIGKDMDFPLAKKLLDYLLVRWQKSVRQSSERTITIGFYGGEPLMNFDLVKQIVEYLSGKELPGVRFVYNMTTNALLLDRYMEFLVHHGFRLLVSLDGAEEDHSQRITTNGKNSFGIVYKNIKELQELHPDYFASHVAFNTVIHAGSNIDRILPFFQTEFKKSTSLSELNNSSIEDKKKYEKIRRDIYQTIASSAQAKRIDKKLMYGSPRISTLTYFLHHLTGEVFRDYRALLYGDKKFTLLAGGTCIPFERKLFVTVNGRILPCERIDHDFSVGRITDEGVELDFEQISHTYNQYYKKLTVQCKHCYKQNACSQCVFYTNIREKKFSCSGFMGKKEFAGYLSLNVDYLENNPWAYKKVMKEVTLF